MARPTYYNFLNHTRKLYQQYIVDEFERHQTMEFHYFKTYQNTIHAKKYNQLKDQINVGDVERSGRVMILPASYTGSDRWYAKKYKNAMAIVRVKGKPTFFITMTMDVKCHEVMDLLQPGKSPYDRPDLICWVYEMKKKKLIDLITKFGIFW